MRDAFGIALDRVVNLAVGLGEIAATRTSQRAPDVRIGGVPGRAGDLLVAELPSGPCSRQPAPFVLGDDLVAAPVHDCRADVGRVQQRFDLIAHIIEVNGRMRIGIAEPFELLSLCDAVKIAGGQTSTLAIHDIGPGDRSRQTEFGGTELRNRLESELRCGAGGVVKGRPCSAEGVALFEPVPYIVVERIDGGRRHHQNRLGASAMMHDATASDAVGGYRFGQAIGGQARDSEMDHEIEVGRDAAEVSQQVGGDRPDAELFDLVATDRPGIDRTAALAAVEIPRQPPDFVLPREIARELHADKTARSRDQNLLTRQHGAHPPAGGTAAVRAFRAPRLFALMLALRPACPRVGKIDGVMSLDGLSSIARRGRLRPIDGANRVG